MIVRLSAGRSLSSDKSMLALTCALTDEGLSNNDKEPRFKLEEATTPKVK